MDSQLLRAVLAMDAYNRGYDEGIDLSNARGVRLGNAWIDRDIDWFADGGVDARVRNFYAISWQIPSTSELEPPELVVAYRGTNDQFRGDNWWEELGLFTGDVWQGWGIGGAIDLPGANQAELAFDFFDLVRQAQSNANPEATVSLTGHSLGGGLAGLVGSVFQKSTTSFDSMPFTQAARERLFFDESVPEAVQSHFRWLVFAAAELEGLIDGDPLDDLIELVSASGEILSVARLATLEKAGTQLDIVPFTSRDIDLYYDRAGFGRDYFGEGHYATGLSPTQLHSMSTLTLRIFADQYEGDWRFAMPHLWRTLYDNQFSSEILDGRVSGGLLDKGRHSDIVSSVLAYSVLEEGELPFGNVAARALFEDAENIGAIIQAVAANSPAAVQVSENLRETLQFISELVVHNSVEFALAQATQTHVSERPTDAGLVDASTVPRNEYLLIDLYAGAIPTDTELSGEESIYNYLFPFARDRFAAVGNANELWDGGFNFSKIVFAGRSEGYLDIRELQVTESEQGEEEPFLVIGGEKSTEVLGSPHDELIFGGSRGTDEIYGGGGRDLIYANEGADKLFGGEESDRLFGGEGDDELHGDSGDDYLVGGPGFDLLTGGDGKDRFVFSPSDSIVDRIVDLEVGDQIEVLIEPGLFNGAVGAEEIDGGIRFFENTSFEAPAEVVVNASLPDGTVLGRVGNRQSGSEVVFEVISYRPISGFNYTGQQYKQGRFEIFSGRVHIDTLDLPAWGLTGTAASESFEVFSDGLRHDVPVQNEEMLIEANDLAVAGNGLALCANMRETTLNFIKVEGMENSHDRNHQQKS